MKMHLKAGAAALALVLAGCGDNGGNTAGGNAAAGGPPQLEQIPAPDNGNWAETVTRTEAGGYLLGNPDAPVKLVEYASLTCPACRAFSVDATAALRDTYVRSGQVSWEFRNFILNGPDMAMSLLSRCLPDAAFFPTVEHIYDQQQELIQRIEPEEDERIAALSPEQRVAPYARAMELDTFFARRGLPEAQFNQCLSDPQGVEALLALQTRGAEQDQVQGTPTFLINGEKVDVSSWQALEPLLRSRAGG